MNPKLWETIKKYIDSEIVYRQTLDGEDFTTKMKSDKEVCKLLDKNISHLSNDDYSEIQKNATSMDEDTFRRWMKDKYTITYF